MLSLIKGIKKYLLVIKNNVNKVLGVVWNNKKDILIYDFSELIKEAETLIPTERKVLRILSQYSTHLVSCHQLS